MIFHLLDVGKELILKSIGQFVNRNVVILFLLGYVWLLLSFLLLRHPLLSLLVLSLFTTRLIFLHLMAEELLFGRVLRVVLHFTGVPRIDIAMIYRGSSTHAYLL